MCISTSPHTLPVKFSQGVKYIIWLVSSFYIKVIENDIMERAWTLKSALLFMGLSFPVYLVGILIILCSENIINISKH